MSYYRSHHHSSFCSSTSSPTSKNADISRLLDPSYASTSTSPSCSYPTVYVDNDGEVHDPDYIQFPSPTFLDASRRRKQQREQRMWASDDDYEDESDEEQQDDEDVYYSRRRSSSLTRPSHRRQQHQRHNRTLSPLPLPLPPLSTSPSPSSLNSVESWLSGGDRDDIFQADRPHSPDHGSVLKKRRSPHLSKKSLFHSPSHSPSYLPSTYSASEPSSPEFAELEVDEPTLTPEVHIRPPSPSAGEALKKEWHAISLSVSIGMFRMKRRVKEAIART